MSLLTRLVAPTATEDRIPIHAFTAAIGEIQRGELTTDAAATAFSLSAAEKLEFTTWYTAEISSNNIDRATLHDILMFGDTGHYTLAQVSTRLNLT